MKIGILTLPLHTNYGGILQAWALQTVLERMGHEVEVINKSRKWHIGYPLAFMVYAKRIIKKYIFGKNVSIFAELHRNQQIDAEAPIRVNTDIFIKKYIRTRNIDNFSEIKDGEYDAIVVGSDQIWRSVYAYHAMQSLKDAYLYFAKDWKKLIRISYAASFGTDTWEYSIRDSQICKNLISKFDAVSVREDSGIELCKNKLFYDKAVRMLDPTLLLDRVDYENLIKTQACSTSYILSYVLDKDNNKENIINKIAKKLGLDVKCSNSDVENLQLEPTQRVQPPIEDWLQGIRDANFVVTDSFHACVFSIIFNKPFIVIANKDRGIARYQTLLSLFNLEKRIIFDVSDLVDSHFESLDNSFILSKRLELVNKSMDFLRMNLMQN